MEYVYVDTSAWVSLADRAEASHERVATTLRSRQGQLVTSDHVLHETWMVMRYRHDAHAAETIVNSIRSGVAKIEVSGLADLEVAAAIGAAFADQDFSLSDRTSWAVMERLGIHHAISLDNDFRIYRFGPDRRLSFTVSP
ncbi:type II toxin-antitoxin system VapC family toxin [Candidatus Poriferisocius sp.]|uniref:type II toxin-antitoxin system VapC family toxin n=1 Tax=Candidatus Poriferisocius sp. TaxID=3101276 RepID=UPI003B01AD0D